MVTITKAIHDDDGTKATPIETYAKWSPSKFVHILPPCDLTF
jgi:hypothetical protein